MAQSNIQESFLLRNVHEGWIKLIEYNCLQDRFKRICMVIECNFILSANYKLRSNFIKSSSSLQAGKETINFWNW